MRGTRATWLTGLTLVAAWRPADAHHSVLPFDNERGTTITGQVERILFTNPHTIIVVNVPGEDGADERWRVESESASMLKRLGWEAATIEAGAIVKVVGARAVDGSFFMRCRQIELENHGVLPCFPLR